MDPKIYISEKLQELNLDELDSIIAQNYSQEEMIFGNVNTSTVIDSLISGESIFEISQIVTKIWELFAYELKLSIITGIEIILITIMTGLLRNLSSSFGEKAVSNISIVVTSIFLTGLCLTNFKMVYEMCMSSVNTMTYTMQVILPAIIPLMIASGSITSGGIISPVITAIITIFNTILTTIVLPGIYISTVFYMINSITEESYVSKLASFIRSASIFICGLCVTLFSAISAIQGIVTETADGLILETTRYSVSNFVPIVGNFASDSIDMVLMCMKLIKNGIGISGIVVLLTLLIVPLIKLIAIASMYKITAIITEPLGDRKVSDTLSQIGNSVIILSVMLFLTSLMFIIFMTIVIGIGN